MTDSIFRGPNKLQFIDTSKEKDTLNPNLLDNSDPTLATNYTGNNELDIPFTPWSLLMSNLGLEDQGKATGASNICDYSRDNPNTGTNNDE